MSRRECLKLNMDSDIRTKNGVGMKSKWNFFKKLSVFSYYVFWIVKEQ